MTASGGPAPARRGEAEAGFTLLEVLVALVVVGVLMAGLTQGLRFGITAFEGEARAAASRGEIEAADRVLRRLVEQMDPGGGNEAPRIAGDARALAFTTDLGAAAAALPVRAADVRLAAEGGRLVLRWTPYRHAVRLGPPPAPERVELLRGVEAIEFAYWARGEGAAAGGWRGEWREQSLPALVRMRLVLAGGSGRRWPDIVAAPIRERPGG